MRVALLAPLLLVALASACARTPTSGGTPATAAPQAAHAASAAASTSNDAVPPSSPAVAPARTKPFPIKSTGLPPERADAATPPKLDTRCRSDADCTVKNVGNCCGAMPACVNVDSPADPAAVKADCAKRGLMSACGFKDIQSCSCVAGTCRDARGDSNPVTQ